MSGYVSFFFTPSCGRRPRVASRRIHPPLREAQRPRLRPHCRLLAILDATELLLQPRLQLLPLRLPVLVRGQRLVLPAVGAPPRDKLGEAVATHQLAAHLLPLVLAGHVA